MDNLCFDCPYCGKRKVSIEPVKKWGDYQFVKLEIAQCDCYYTYSYQEVMGNG